MTSLKVLEDLQDIDRRLIDWLAKGGLSEEERNALIEARAGLVRVASYMLVAKILDSEDYRKFSDSSMKEMRRAVRRTWKST